MLDHLENLAGEFEAERSQVRDLAAWQILRDRWLGRERGVLSSELRKLGSIDPALRPEYGKRLNRLKADLESTLEATRADLKILETQRQAERERVDITLPGVLPCQGHRHPILRVKEDLESVLTRMGFSILETPEVEDEFHNFAGLNFPQDHPSRDSQDTFYLDDNVLLRTHCTCVQIHSMLAGSPPLRVIGLGKVYRRDSPDATHSPVFYQCDGFTVDRGITLSDMKGTLETALRELFEMDLHIRLRPSYFPFVEPGAEVDISCIFCGGKGCRICKSSGWIEILGAGMIHPQVLKNVGIDWRRYSGYAWGMGLDRIAMLKYGIDDIRLLYENDMRFLSQF